MPILHTLDREFDGGVDNHLIWDGAHLVLTASGVRRVATVRFEVAIEFRVYNEYEMPLGHGGYGDLKEIIESDWLTAARARNERLRISEHFNRRHFEILMDSWGLLECIAHDVSVAYEENAQ